MILFFIRHCAFFPPPENNVRNDDNFPYMYIFWTKYYLGQEQNPGEHARPGNHSSVFGVTAWRVKLLLNTKNTCN